ncbi:MAG: hypothetical protein IPK82_19660 [Polyangiaceae bacterium]|nr:hypothetical protein [Polyangiaceae bacterium]
MFCRSPMFALVLCSPAAFGCQLLYEKNDLTVATGGSSTTGTDSTSSTGGSGGSTTSSTTSSASTSSSGGGGTGGVHTSSTSANTGGSGGFTTSTGGTGGVISSSSTTGGGGTGGTTTTSTQPVCTDPLFVFATADTAVFCGTFADPAWMFTSSATSGNGSRPAAVLTSATAGVGVFYEGPQPGMGSLRYVELSGTCGAPANVPMATTKAPPAAAVLNGDAQVLFQGAVGAGTDHPFQTTWDPATMWTLPAQIDANVFSPMIAGLAASATDMLAVYGGGNDALFRVRFANGWQLPASCFKDAMNNCEFTNKNLAPGVAALGSDNYLVVFQELANLKSLRFLKGNGTTNTPSQKISTAESLSPVALAPTTSGAILAFHGTDNKVYASVYTTATDMWSPIAQVGTGTTFTSPAVAKGVCTHDAELVYIDTTDKQVHHAWLNADGTWQVAPNPIGGENLKGVALTTF